MLNTSMPQLSMPDICYTRVHKHRTLRAASILHNYAYVKPVSGMHAKRTYTLQRVKHLFHARRRSVV